MQQRVENGFIRECHGDLHLGNIAIVNKQVTLFDCIEFNPELRWIDTISEAAFVVMDLYARGYSEFAWRFINHYLAATGDYDGIALLRYYIVYRAMVRAKVNPIRSTQENDQNTASVNGRDECLRYLDLAQFWKKHYHPAIIVMHGLSGSGKSTLASQLVEQLGAIQIGSDSERKRLFDLKSQDNSASQLDQGIYTKDATQLTYDRLAQLTQIIISAGFSVIVDASFLKLSYRYQFKQLALENEVAHLVISCEEPESVLRSRIIEQNKVGEDPSEATIAVLEKQLQTQDILSTEELTDTFTVICTDGTLNSEQLQAIKVKVLSTANVPGWNSLQ
jgi:predicted kinase